MFSEQIRLLNLLINDWDNIKSGINNHGWDLHLGLCDNCKLSIYDFSMELENESISDASDIKEAMWKHWSGYSGCFLYPLTDYERYFCNGDDFTKTPERLDLAKSCLEFLTGYVNGTIKVEFENGE